MSKRGNGYGNHRVNILKKVKVGKTWNFYPAVVEPSKLRDKVLVCGKVEVHPEGCYYIEWRKDGSLGTLSNICLIMNGPSPAQFIRQNNQKEWGCDSTATDLDKC
jgi:hypothetical protein